MQEMDLGDVGQVLIASREKPDTRKCQVISDHKSKTNMTQSHHDSTRYFINQDLLFCVANRMVANAISTLRSGCFKVSSNAKFQKCQLLSFVTD